MPDKKDYFDRIDNENFLLLIIKLFFLSSLLLISPLRISLLGAFTIIIMIILRLNINNLICILASFRFDLISISILILTLWLYILIRFSQIKTLYFKSFFFCLMFLILSLIFSFSSTNIIMFYFFFWMVSYSNFYYYYRMRISNRAYKSQLIYAFLYFICFITIVTCYYYNNYSKLFQVYILLNSFVEQNIHGSISYFFHCFSIFG